MFTISDLAPLLLAIRKRMLHCRCTLMLDIDETLLNPLYRWQEHVNARMGVSLTMQQIEQSGGLDNVFRASAGYSAFCELAEELRANENFNTALPCIEGAQEGIQKLLRVPFLCIGGYLTTRPGEVASVTKSNLLMKGFPPAPLLTRPAYVPREATTQWKLAVLEELARDYAGILLLVDDAIPIAKAICERNYTSEKFIVAILFNGPLTHTTVQCQAITDRPEEHFYVADWESIPHICAAYASNIT